MFIQTESTPNPDTLKFLPGESILEDGRTANFTGAGEAEGVSPLAETLFRIEGVTGVFLGSDFISVTKKSGLDWPPLKTVLLTTIMDYFVAGKPVMLDGATGTDDATGEGDSEVVAQIKELINTRVRPAVAMDGGDIIYHGFEEGVVKLELHGSCAGCPSSTITLKQGIENMLKHYVPEVVSVEAVN